jgi:hypothetical protein
MGKVLKLLRNNQRRMVRKHDAARTYSDGLSVFGYIPDQQRRHITADVLRVVMFGKPNPF